ncbi:MAG: hypothetical protein HKP48_04835 [Winogradskyella sp.]|uniref:hypothetical protein n=1 Tax=Winogradskyella sp. TaxID=1883156 RepID=UPI00179A7271|nr:hypothetical protein [Winogradskyella sp.]MBT8245175.1 hypothetical protein [Winogradskyella sp.]NNK22624.1 hypothetical protein [Winogradskyella sp.]
MLGIIISCFEKDFKLPENANELLTNNSRKTWKLAKRFNGDYKMNMGDCFLSYRVTYSSKRNTTDNNSKNKDCGASMEARWNFHTNENGHFIKLEGENVKKAFNKKKDISISRF